MVAESPWATDVLVRILAEEARAMGFVVTPEMERAAVAKMRDPKNPEDAEPDGNWETP